MKYVYPIVYLDDNESFSLSCNNYTSNATGMNLFDLTSEIYGYDVSIVYLWWIVPIVFIIVLILNMYPLR